MGQPAADDLDVLVSSRRLDFLIVGVGGTTMLDYMDYIQLAFAEATNWNRDNSYSSLTTTAQSIIDFSTPERLRVRLSSLSTPHFATSYTLGTVGLLDGSVSYLFSTVPFHNTPSRSALIPLRKISPGYREVQAPVVPAQEWNWNSILDSISIPGFKDGSHSASQNREDGHVAQNQGQRKATLLHASLHLPSPTTLYALFLRRISPTTQLSVAVCSTQGPPLSKSAPQASMLTQLSHDTGKYCNEYLFSTDNALFGWRGLWNFGPDPRYTPKDAPPRVSLLSAGAEAYYSPISSLVGMSTGLRFTTLPAATEVPSTSSTSSKSTPISTFPYTLTLTLTPITGSLSTTYSLCASRNLSFSSRFGFNVYSWESEMVAGCELWRKKPKSPVADDGLEWARRKMRLHDFSAPLPGSLPYSPLTSDPAQPDSAASDESASEADDSVIKLRIDQSWNIRLLWEGRVKELLVSAGVGLGPGSFSPSPGVSSATPGSGSTQSGGGAPGSSYWRGVGVSVMYSS